MSPILGAKKPACKLSMSMNYAKEGLVVDVKGIRASQNRPKLATLSGSEKNLLKKLKD
jgi:hypothetical protein